MDTSVLLNGFMDMGAILMVQHVTVQLMVGISHFYSGAVPMDALGVNMLVQGQLRMVISQ
jgi:hypothetical protein